MTLKLLLIFSDKCAFVDGVVFNLDPSKPAHEVSFS